MPPREKPMTSDLRAAIIQDKENLLLDGIEWPAMLKRVAKANGVSLARVRLICMDEDEGPALEPVDRVEVDVDYEFRR